MYHNTPFGKYKYNRLPMGLKCSTDFVQEVMENILTDIEETDVYIDDVGIFSDTWEHHMTLLDKVLGQLKDNGFTVNPLKCEWAVQETDWLGYWLLPTGLKPRKKKIDAFLKLTKPKNLKELRGFIGLVNYYCNMWPHRSHIQAPLTAKTGSNKKGTATVRKYNWMPEMDAAFQKTKALMATDGLCAYPNHNKPFVIYTNASDLQMGAIITQENKPVAYWSQKFNEAQLNYTTMEKELLSIVAVLDKFCTMLLGADITVYTDHKNLTFDTFTLQRVLRWRTACEDYSPKLIHVVGVKNIVADQFSRLEHHDDDHSSQSLVGEKKSSQLAE